MEKNIKESPRRRTRRDWIIEAVTLMALTGCFIPLLLIGNLPPDTVIPVHYNIKFEPDGWGHLTAINKAAYIALGLYLLMTVCELFYKGFNFPVKVTEKNAEALYRLGTGLLRRVKLLVIMMFCGITWQMYMSALGKTTTPLWVIIMLFGLVLITIGYWRKMRAQKDI